MEKEHTDITIRPATEADYEELKELFAQGADIHHAGEPGIIGGSSERPVTSRWFSRLLRNPANGVLVAELPDAQPGGWRIAGFTHLVFQDVTGIPGLVPRRYVLVVDIEVRPSAQGRGIGHRLMSATEAWATSRGATQIELSVWEFNSRARALYEELGYRTIYRQLLKEISPPTTGTYKDQGEHR